MYSFLIQNPNLSIRKAEGILVALARGVKKNTVDEYFKLLENVLNENDLIIKPSNILNMNETDLQLNIRHGELVAIKSSKKHDISHFRREERNYFNFVML